MAAPVLDLASQVCFSSRFTSRENAFFQNAHTAMVMEEMELELEDCEFMMSSHSYRISKPLHILLSDHEIPWWILCTQLTTNTAKIGFIEVEHNQGTYEPKPAEYPNTILNTQFYP